MIRILESESKFKSPKDLLTWMQQNIIYCDFTMLKSHDQVESTRFGSCHDQVMFELEELRRMDLKPKAAFFMELHPEKSYGGETHSFVYYEKDGNTYWFENAWADQKGLRKFDSFDDIKSKIKKMHESGKFGDIDQFPEIEWRQFRDDKHSPGDSLNDLVRICLSKGGRPK